MNIKIAHLYPELLNLYSDIGNIVALEKRLSWRNIESEVINFNLSDDIDLSDVDILVVSGGGDRETKTVCRKLQSQKKVLSDYIENNGVVLAIDGGFRLLGTGFELNGEVIKGLGILDYYSDYCDTNLIGNTVIKTEFLDYPVVGFENHYGRTFINSYKPFGEVNSGKGNNGTDGKEGIMYKNFIGTNLHGPLLPKNPHLTDYILTIALKNKYGEVELSPLDDSVELDANNYIVNKYSV